MGKRLDILRLGDRLNNIERRVRNLEHPDPAPPLRARVAQALGMTISESSNHPGTWIFMTGAVGASAWKRIPPYDEDVKLAIGAGLEYSRLKNVLFSIRREGIDEPAFKICFRYGPIITVADVEHLAEGICEAIAKHSEGE